MSESGGTSGGIFARARVLADKVLQLAETRLELISVELQEEKCRIIESLIWATAAVFLGGMAIVMTTVTMIFVIWATPEARVLSLAILSLFYISAAFYCLRMLKKKLRNSGMPFEESLREIKKDRECLDIHN